MVQLEALVQGCDSQSNEDAALAARGRTSRFHSRLSQRFQIQGRVDPLASHIVTYLQFIQDVALMRRGI
ncbi:Hypothetical protein SMAX5B_001417 [Scophthalmus maximus]|uniref:Uncharacterized protein n=1 Tax=Scophthalmus maximus TaxID=52904 RepID=A0A2U9B742_SCOMX|nr:Hypothetical protein SMAX5B_001417 [Scophthalmus maximus]KAF0021479.1 hypothetical protein F2P81_026268 [Scophthalmus maximus]